MNITEAIKSAAIIAAAVYPVALLIRSAEWVADAQHNRDVKAGRFSSRIELAPATSATEIVAWLAAALVIAASFLVAVAIQSMEGGR